MEQSILESFDVWCKKNNTIIFSAVKNHICSNECSLWNVPNLPKEEIAFVCMFSRQIHYCGVKCKHAQESRNSEDYICRLTGWVLPFLVEKQFVSLSKDNHTNTKYQCTSSIKMGSIGSHRKRAHKTKNMLTKDNVVQILNALFAPRPKKTLHQLDYIKQCANAAKVTNKSPPLRFLTLHQKFFKIASKYQKMHSLHHTNLVSTIQIDKLATAIIRYKQQLNIPWTMTHKTVITLTAVIVSKLRQGYNVNGIVVFPKIEWIYYSAPKETEFSGIMGLQCRSMSILWRKLQAIIINSASGMPSYDKLFTLAY